MARWPRCRVLPIRTGPYAIGDTGTYGTDGRETYSFLRRWSTARTNGGDVIVPGEAPHPSASGGVTEAVLPSPENRLAMIHGLAAAGGPQMTLQPILDLRSMRLLAVEALPLFPDGAEPERWSADARGLGVTLELELAAVASALSTIKLGQPTLPEDVGLWVSVSPGTVCAPELGELLHAAVVPVTVMVGEPAVVAEYPGLPAAVSGLRRAGIRFAVKGVAAGYSGLRHILGLRPDAVRLDRGLTHDIHRDLARYELTRAVARVTHHLGAFLVADGIEVAAEVDTLLALGITAGQGVGLPDPVPPQAVGPVAATGSAGGAGPATGSGAARKLEELVRPVLELVIRLTGLETAYLTVLDPDQEWLEHRFVCNAGTLEVPEGLTIPWVDSLCKRCRDAGLLWTADVPGDLPPIPLGGDFPIKTFVSVPITLADGRTAGTLCAMSSVACPLDGDMLAELAFFARLLAERHGPDFGGGGATGGIAPLTHSHEAVRHDVGASPSDPGA